MRWLHVNAVFLASISVLSKSACAAPLEACTPSLSGGVITRVLGHVKRCYSVESQLL